MRKLALLVGVVLLFGTCLGVTYQWVGTEGDWSDGRNWVYKDGAAAGATPPTGPNSDTDDVEFSRSAKVRVDGDFTIGNLSIQASNATDGEKLVEMIGPGSITLAATATGDSLLLSNYRRLVLGTRLISSRVIYIQNYATLCVTNGGHLATSGTIYAPSWKSLGAPATLRVDGGRATNLAGTGGIRFETFDNDTTIAVTSGELLIASYNNNGADTFINVSGGRAVFDTLKMSGAGALTLTGGELRCEKAASSISDATDILATGGRFFFAGSTLLRQPGLLGLLAKPDSRLELALSGNHVTNIVDFDSSVRNVTVDGTLIVTNTSNPSYAGVSFSCHDFTLTGKGTLVAGELVTQPAVSTATVSIANLVLGREMHTTYINGQEAIHLRFPRPITLGAYRDWTVEHAFSQLHFKDTITVDTADWFDRTTPRTIQLYKMHNDDFIDIVVKGTGTFKPFYSYAGAGAVLNSVDVRDSATFYPYCGNWNCPGLRCRQTHFDPDAKLVLGSPPPIFTFETDFLSLPSSVQVAAIASDTVTDAALAVMTPFTPGSSLPEGLLARTTFLDSGLADDGRWKLVLLNGSIACVPSADVEISTDTPTSRWTGAKDGSLSDTANWSDGAPVSGSSSVFYFDGIRNTVVTNDYAGTLAAQQLYFTTKAGPFTLRGNPITLLNTANGVVLNEAKYNCAIAAVRYTLFPIVIENDLTASAGDYFTVYNAGRSYIAFMGDVDATAASACALSGDIRICGDFTCRRISPLPCYVAGTGRPTMITVANGATLTLTNNSSYFSDSYNAFFKIDEGGLMTVKAGYFGMTSVKPVQLPHIVNGTLDVQCAISTWNTTDHKYGGSGTFKVAAVNGGGYGNGWVIPFNVYDTLKVYNRGTWGKGLQIVIHDSPTLGAMNDWTYEDGNDRAVLLADAYATLTVNTQDPETSAGHEVTINAPITGDGALVKDGAGTLTLGNAGNAIGGGVRVKAGALALSAAQTFSSLTVDSGATLVFPDGSSPITVTGDLSLDGARLEPSADALADMGLGWTTLLAVPEGASIIGEPVTTGIRYRTITENGLVKLQGRVPPGAILLVR